jgi:hypothetical protein
MYPQYNNNLKIYIYFKKKKDFQSDLTYHFYYKCSSRKLGVSTQFQRKKMLSYYNIYKTAYTTKTLVTLEFERRVSY